MENIKDILDSMSILEKSNLIKEKATEIQAKNRTISNSKAINMASDIVLRGKPWSY